ncbi:MAG: tRNA (5-methylaminomethyl-2-thiouridine)(34)-methyltransferase MnmD [Bacteroidales bacterium]|jgi:tRNA U34 5-methylaminomethyl-2-thiouridine-forming methyltransferase MnmC|nr:tRNA (5-methylaminomethyl-2-thiouridine)(34)-methyltransferase MnmD [Bacteroidales bacterium]MCU0408325.1 tRNA (5-methylaminomethyl-2-thiouridine)(34)-methyltransferase MnmD [Bacteroidales bacterium]
MTEIIRTSDGSDTIYVPQLNEHYHSVHGAIQESEHIFIGYGLQCCASDPVRILEIGMGTGLNALLTAIRANASGQKIHYTTIEKYPISPETAKLLNYPSITGEGSEAIFKAIHSCAWEEFSDITRLMKLKKIRADFTSLALEGEYDLFYFDAFGPDKQPEMWTSEVFEKISAVSAPGSILVTYSAKGEVKRKLRSSGFEVTMLPGPPGKREIIRAVRK